MNRANKSIFTCNTALEKAGECRWLAFRRLQFVLIPLLCLFSVGSQAGAEQWSSTNIQYLYGTNYELGDDTRSIVTLERVSGWAYGDNFFFVDIENPDRSGTNTDTGYYGEISPRLSLSKMSGTDLSAGIIQDVLLTFTAELGEGFRNYLYGLAVDLKLPAFSYFQVNWYVRNEITFPTDRGQQVTLVWGLPFKTGPLDWTFEGFADYAWGLDPSEDNLITAPRLLVDIGEAFGAPGTLQAGVEYQIWRNKFGIDGVDEDVPQLMLKWFW